MKSCLPGVHKWNKEVYVNKIYVTRMKENKKK